MLVGNDDFVDENFAVPLLQGGDEVGEDFETLGLGKGVEDLMEVVDFGTWVEFVSFCTRRRRRPSERRKD